MKKLNRKSTKIFNQITAGLNSENPYRKLGEDGETFMPVHVDYLYETEHGTVYAIAHNYRQNGDTMADPDMEFLVNKLGIFPMTYQLDGLGIFQRAIEIRDGRLLYARKLQNQLKNFANDWMININEQQDLQ